MAHLLIQVSALGMASPLAIARAQHATRLNADYVMDMLPSIAASSSGGGSIELPAGCTGSKFQRSWQTRTFFDDSDDEQKLRFEEDNYEFMRDDSRRTLLYYAAIRERLATSADQVVLDLGTGSLALLALEAARAGAKKVYAIESQSDSARLAREAVAAAGYSGVVEIVEGKSTCVTLPEKVDLLVSETVGSMASEEGLYATMADAHRRHVKRPTEAASWIPHRVQTMGAPCSWALHYGLGLPDYDWFQMPTPPRIAAEDATVQLLSSPQLVEDIDLTRLESLLAAGSHALTPSEGVVFTIEADRMRANQRGYEAACTPPKVLDGRETGSSAAEAREAAASFAAGVASSLSGIAMWPRLALDPASKWVVEARGSECEPQPSSWQILVPLISDRPMPIAAGNTVTMKVSVELGEGVETPPRYNLEGVTSFVGLTKSTDEAT